MLTPPISLSCCRVISLSFKSKLYRRSAGTIEISSMITTFKFSKVALFSHALLSERDMNLLPNLKPKQECSVWPNRVFQKKTLWKRMKRPPQHATGGYLVSSNPEGSADCTSLGGWQSDLKFVKIVGDIVQINWNLITFQTLNGFKAETKRYMGLPKANLNFFCSLTSALVFFRYLLALVHIISRSV